MSPRLLLLIQLYSSPRYAKLPWHEIHDGRPGEVNGLPGLRGRLRAHCDGLAILETELGELRLIHREWFIADPSERSKEETLQASRQTTKKTKPTAQALLERYGII
jgi:hypothetical protein